MTLLLLVGGAGTPTSTGGGTATVSLSGAGTGAASLLGGGTATITLSGLGGGTLVGQGSGSIAVLTSGSGEGLALNALHLLGPFRGVTDHGATRTDLAETSPLYGVLVPEGTAPPDWADVTALSDVIGLDAVLDKVTTTTGESFAALIALGWAWPTGTSVYHARLAPNGHILLGSITTTDNNVRTTYRTQSYLDYDPVSRRARVVELPTTTGLYETTSDAGIVGGSDVSDFTIVGDDVYACSTVTDWGWDLTVKGRYRALIKLVNDGTGAWVPDLDGSYTYDELRALDPTNGASAWPDIANSRGQVCAQSSGLNEMATLPASGHVVVANYFGGSHSGSVSVIDAETGVQKAWFHFPAATLANGTPVTVACRTVVADPSSAANDERFVIFFDTFITATSAGTPAPFMELSYNAATQTITPKSGMVSPQYLSSRAVTGCFAPDGTLFLVQSNPAGLGLGTFPTAVWAKHAGERRYVTLAPYNVNSMTTEWGIQPDPDLEVATLGGNAMYPFSGIRHVDALDTVAMMNGNGTLQWHTFDSPIVASSNVVTTNPQLNTNVTGWQQLYFTSTVAWQATNGGRLAVTGNAASSKMAAGTARYNVPADCIGGTMCARATTRTGGTQRSVQVGLEFFDGGGTTLGQFLSDLLPQPASGTITINHGCIVPTGAVQFRLFVQWSANVNGEVQYIEKGSDGLATSVVVVPVRAQGTTVCDTTQIDDGAAVTLAIGSLFAVDDDDIIWMPLQGLDSGGTTGDKTPPQWLLRIDLPALITAAGDSGLADITVP